MLYCTSLEISSPVEDFEEPEMISKKLVNR
jgi:hypothetical protein